MKAKSKKTSKSVKNYAPYAKGLKMTADMLKNPDAYQNRVCVAYDKDRTKKPYLYVLIGKHDHSNEHQIRKVYAKTVGVPYYDTRILLYSTIVKRHQEGEYIFGNRKALVV
jgi:hypothetical protein